MSVRGTVPVRIPDGRDTPTDPQACPRCGRRKSPRSLQCRRCHILSTHRGIEDRTAGDPELRRRAAENRRRAQGDYAALEQWAGSGFVSYGRVWR